MVCPRCTLLHAEAAATCQQCGYRFTNVLQQYGALATRHARVKIGAVTGAVLISCLVTAVLLPAASAMALSIGAYAGIVSITNSWLAACTTAENERAAEMRSTVFSAALMYSLAAELARLHGADRIVIPGLNNGDLLSMPVPSAALTELIAAVLIVMDPLLANPVVRWVGEGVERTD